MMSVSKQLSEYLHEKSPLDFSSGTLERMNWKTRKGGFATGDSVKRRLNELVEDKTLLVEVRNGVAWFRWNDGNEKPKPVFYTFHPLTGERITTEQYATL